jgi:putative salt-induced outer membrane protein YdiY
VPVVASAQATAGFAWQNATELSFVSTSGNASSSTLGLKATLEGVGGENSVKLEMGGIRARSEFTIRTATGTPTDFTVADSSRTQLTAESYFARTRYDRAFGRSFAFGGTGWDRNTFAGIQDRLAFVGGLGRSWVETDNGHIKTDVGLTYTIQKDVDPAPGTDENFGGWRASLDVMRLISANTELASVLAVDNSLEDTEDLRADWVSSLSVSITSALALKTSLQVLWDNQPALVSVPLLTAGGVPTGVNVLSPGSEVDRVLTLALVIRL